MKTSPVALAIGVLCLLSFPSYAQDGNQQNENQQIVIATDSSEATHSMALRALTPLSDTAVIGGRMMFDESSGVDVDFSFNFGTKTEDDVVKGIALNVRAALIRYMQKGRISPYYKAGVSLGVFTSDFTQDDDIGLFAALGAEFFIIPDFSLFAEAGLGVGLSPFSINTNSTRAGLAFYF